MGAVGDLLGSAVAKISGAAERASGTGLKAMGSFVRKGVGGALGGAAKSLWGTTGRMGMYGESRASIPGVLREMFPSVRNRTLGALPKFGMAGGIDSYLQTPEGESKTGAQRFGLQAVSFGMRFGAYRSLARGVAGTVLGASGRMVGSPGRYYDQYKYIANKLGPMWKSGSLTNMALKGAGFAAREVAWTPVRAVVGIPGMAKPIAGVSGRMFGDTFAGRALGVSGRSMSSALHPKIGGQFGRGLRAFGIINKEMDAPIMSSLMLAGAGAQYFKSEAEYNQRNGNWLTGARYNPANYGAGISAMRRGQAQNYGPALTLQLHANHRRVMP